MKATDQAPPSLKRFDTRQHILLGVGIIVSILIASLFPPKEGKAQQILQALEPGAGYARLKQWAIENKLVFETFTKDALVVRDTGVRQWESIRIQARFCGGDDYSGRASSLILQQFFDPKDPKVDVLSIHRDYIEFLAGKANADGKMPGTFSVRRDKKDGSDGVAVSQENEKGYWEIGLFKKDQFTLLQTVRRRETVCQ
jgi:hypothetical protein